MTTIISKSTTAPSTAPSSTAPPSESVNLTEAEVRAVAGGWRVSDSRLRADDPQRLLGFVEVRGDQFEVMRIGADFTWTLFASMGEALAHLLTVGRQDAALRAAGDLGWIAALPKSSFEDY